MAVAVPAGVNQSAELASRAFKVTVYSVASAVLVDWANTMFGGFEADKVIRLKVALVGVYVTWYSIAGVIPQFNGAAIKDFVVVALVITFWLAPAT